MSIATNNAVSKIKMGRISDVTMGLARLIFQLFSVKFKIREVEADDYDEDINEENEDENGGEDGSDEEDYGDGGNFNNGKDLENLPK
jgi:hypothetical protein